MKNQHSTAILPFDMRERLKKRVGEILIEAGVLTAEKLNEALSHQKKEGGLLGQILISLGIIKEESLVAALGHQLQVPYIPLQNYAINPDALTLFDEEFCRQNLVLAFEKDEKRLFLAMSDPLNEMAVETVEKQCGLKVQVFISTPSEIMSTLDLAFAAASAKKELKKAS